MDAQAIDEMINEDQRFLIMRYWKQYMSLGDPRLMRKRPVLLNGAIAFNLA